MAENSPVDSSRQLPSFERVVSDVARGIQRKPTKATGEEASEYEYRDAKYEYE